MTATPIITALGFCLVVLASQPTSAGFVDKKSAWDALPALEKQGYAMGLVDMWAGTWNENPETFQYKRDVLLCTVSLELNSSHMVEIIETGYSELETWSHPPLSPLLIGLRKACLSTINQARRKRGEALLSE